ncbi:MAG: hypothetical protein ABW022_15870 [Actinoplanes sp.]
MPDLVGLGALLVPGPVLFLLALVVLCLSHLWVYGRGRRDQARWAVSDRVGAEVTRSAVPRQREPK